MWSGGVGGMAPSLDPFQLGTRLTLHKVEEGKKLRAGRITGYQKSLPMECICNYIPKAIIKICYCIEKQDIWLALPLHLKLGSFFPVSLYILTIGVLEE